MSDRAAVACSHCGHLYALPKAFLGKKATCKACGEKFVAIETALPTKQPGAGSTQPAPSLAAQMQTTSAAPPAPSRQSIVLPSKREVPLATPKAPGSGLLHRASDRGIQTPHTLDDSVMSWLDEEPDDQAAPQPRVVTTADICDPSQRQLVRGPNGTPPKDSGEKLAPAREPVSGQKAKQGN